MILQELEEDSAEGPTSHLNSLREAEDALGTKTFTEFFSRMREEMKELVTSRQEMRKNRRKMLKKSTKSNKKIATQKPPTVKSMLLFHHS